MDTCLVLLTMVVQDKQENASNDFDYGVHGALL